MPIMSNNQAEQSLLLIEEVLDEAPENSIFKNNINPIRTGLQIYKFIDKLSESFVVSNNKIETLK